MRGFTARLKRNTEKTKRNEEFAVPREEIDKSAKARLKRSTAKIKENRNLAVQTLKNPKPTLNPCPNPSNLKQPKFPIPQKNGSPQESVKRLSS